MHPLALVSRIFPCSEIFESGVFYHSDIGLANKSQAPLELFPFIIYYQRECIQGLV